MKKSLAIIGLSAALSACALAQESRALGLSLKFGQALPQGAAARAEGNTWTIFGVDTKVKDLRWERGNGQYLTASVDVYTKGDFQSIPILLNYVSRTNEMYFLVGLGVALTEDFHVVGSNRVKDETVELGYAIGVGYDFQWMGAPLFGEARFLGNGNDRLNAFGITIGIRL